MFFILVGNPCCFYGGGFYLLKFYYLWFMLRFFYTLYNYLFGKKIAMNGNTLKEKDFQKIINSYQPNRVVLDYSSCQWKTYLQSAK